MRLCWLAAPLVAVCAFVACSSGAQPPAPRGLETAAPSGPVGIELPDRANDAVRIRDRASGVAVGVRLLGARASTARLDADSRTYASVLPHADVTIRRHARGFEDFTRFASKPARESVRYALELDGVSGLRLVDRVLELLDAEGAPRLRMARPWIRAHDGAIHDVAVALSGCVVDTEPRAPWGRPTSAPGARSCEIELSWQGQGVTYPALLDPAWSSTGDMVDARAGGAACRLLDGRVLVVGGAGVLGSPSPSLAAAELFDPATKTWATTSPMSTKREKTRCVTLADGRVLVAGGSNALQVTLPTWQTYQLDGSWLTEGFLPNVRAEHSLTLLPDGRALAIAGTAGLGQLTDSVDSFDPSTNTWSSAGNLLGVRRGHSAALLPDGRVLVVGGNDASPFSSAELFDPSTGTSQETGSMLVAHDDFPLVWLGSELFAVGGTTTNGFVTDQLESYNVALGLWQTRASLPLQLTDHVAVPLGSNQLLVAGGYSLIRNNDAFVYDPAADAWSTAGAFEHREEGLGVALADGSALVLGGYVEPNLDATNTALVFQQLELGVACGAPGECVSTNCADGVCCDAPCAGVCEACGPSGGCTPVLLAADPNTCFGAQMCDSEATCKAAPGVACSSPEMCATGHCIDGVCCDQACSGSCEACDGQAPGSCALVVGAPHAERPPCADGSICNGLSDACAAFSLCEDGHIAIAADGAREDCAPFACAENGVCLTECVQLSNCAEPFLCDTKGSCVAPNFDRPEPGCGFGKATRSGGQGARLLAVALGLALVLRGRGAAGWRGRRSSAPHN